LERDHGGSSGRFRPLVLSFVEAVDGQY